MNVAELRAALENLDGSLDVHAEGCDCINPVSNVTTDYESGKILIEVKI